MTVRGEIDQRLLEGFTGVEHSQHNRVLRELIRLEERDHHLIFGAGAVREDEQDEIGDADQDQDRECAFLVRVHGRNDTILSKPVSAD